MRIYLIAALLLLPVVAGCQNEPFQIVAPSHLRDTGTALVSARIPAYARGLIQRVHITVTSADTSRIRTIERDLNFPIPGGNLSTGQVADIPAGVRRFTVAAFDTDNILRFRGAADSTVSVSQAKLVEVELARIGGAVDFLAAIDLAALDTTRVDSAQIASLPLTSVLDILELVPQPHHSSVEILPLASVGLGERFTALAEGAFSRRILVEQIPTGTRQFVAHLKDLGSDATLAFADTLSVAIDTLDAAQATFDLKLVEDPQQLFEIFYKTTLPRDSTVVVVNPQF